MPDTMSIGNQLGIKNPLTGQALGFSPMDVSDPRKKFTDSLYGAPIGYATNNGYFDMQGQPTYFDKENIEMRPDPNTGRMMVYNKPVKPFYNIPSPLSQTEIMPAEQNTQTVQTQATPSKYRLPKEYLDAYIKAIQGDETPVKYTTAKPVDPLGSSLAAILQGFAEGGMTKVQKKVTGDIGKGEYMQNVVKPLGQAMGGNENMFLNKQGELSGGIPVEYSDLATRQQLLGKIMNELEIAKRKGLSEIFINEYKQKADMAAQNGDANSLMNLLVGLQAKK